ncbi:MAG: M28 family peptidase [Bacteroidetes bacterium]|nr:M28 family peptidase [Bacteroidota bacterium]
MKKHSIILLLLCIQIANAFPTITEINPAIDSLMNRVNIDSLESKIRYLQNLGPRPAQTSHMNPNNTEGHKQYLNNIAAKNWLYQQYENIGNLDVYFHHFLPESQCDTIWNIVFNDTTFFTLDTARNVVAVQIGTEFPDEYVIVCSHFDTYSNGSPLSTPGADDNASGTSGVLEIARVLSPHSFKRSIIYLNNNGEELGISGAALFAYYCKENNINISGVFNLDMIGYNPIDMPLKIFYNDRPPINKDLAKYFDEVSALYLPDIPALPNQDEDTNSGKQGMGDCFMFIKYDYPAMYMGDVLGYGLDGWFSAPPCYHQTCDTIGIGKEDAGVNSMELVKAYTQTALVAIAELAELDDNSIKEEKPISCVITPNPTSGTATFTLYFDDVGHLTITLNNVLGQEIMELNNSFVDTKTFIKTFSLSHLPIGVYYLKIIHNGNAIIEKIVIET